MTFTESNSMVDRCCTKHIKNIYGTSFTYYEFHSHYIPQQHNHTHLTDDVQLRLRVIYRAHLHAV